MTNKEKFIDNTPFISFVEVITALEYHKSIKRKHYASTKRELLGKSLLRNYLFTEIVKQDEFNYFSLQQQKNVIYNGC